MIKHLVNALDLDLEDCQHDWWAFNVDRERIVILCQCRNCGAMGEVHNHTPVEWGAVANGRTSLHWPSVSRVRVAWVPESNDWIPLA